MTVRRGLRDWTGAGRRGRASDGLAIQPSGPRRPALRCARGALAGPVHGAHARGRDPSASPAQLRWSGSWRWSYRRGARVLEVGCGAGLLAVDFAARGYDVDCIDTSRAMVELAACSGEIRGTTPPGSPSIPAMCTSWPSARAPFDLVVALGVVPFLHSPQKALAEMARVTRSGGWVLFMLRQQVPLEQGAGPALCPVPGAGGA